MVVTLFKAIRTPLQSNYIIVVFVTFNCTGRPFTAVPADGLPWLNTKASQNVVS